VVILILAVDPDALHSPFSLTFRTMAGERNKIRHSLGLCVPHYGAWLFMLFSRKHQLSSRSLLVSRPVLFVLLLWSASPSGQAQILTPSTSDIANKSIEELMNIDVTSVSRKEQKLSKIPAAVYVITQQAIERSGVNIIPDLLRMVPGVQVAQVEADRWAISVRGFNDIYSNKVLVLVDGRTVYTPSFSGVYWDQLDIPLDTIERIEVIRGPGGTVWGANAVNGVISIITKSSKETPGLSITAGAGSQQTADFEARYGGNIGSGLSYRAFGHYTSFASLATPEGRSGNDAWRMRHAGFRADWNKSGKDTFMLEGGIFQTNGGQAILAPANTVLETAAAKLTNTGGNILTQWTHRYSGSWDSTLAVYDTNYSRHDTGITEKLNVLDFDYQNHVRVGSRNDVVWGTGYRNTADRIGSSMDGLRMLRTIGYTAAVRPPSKDYNLFSAFLQDEIHINEDLSFTIGSKFEHNAFSGFEYEPSARLAWTPTGTQTLWLAASKAVRQPSRYDTGIDVSFPVIPVASGVSLNQTFSGNPNLKAEQLLDYEAGYRTALGSGVLIDLTAFYSFYNNLEAPQLGAPTSTIDPSGLLITLPVVFANSYKAQNYGSELAVTWNAASQWKLVGSYSWLKMNVARSPADSSSTLQWFRSTSPAGFPLASLQQVLQSANQSIVETGSTARVSPRSQFGIQSYLDLTSRLTFDSSLYFVGGLPAAGVPAYARLDSRLGWKLRKGIDASIVGQNLLSPHHLEFGNVEQAIATEVDRSVFGKIVWTF